MTGWTPVPGTNSDRYIIDAEDRGYYLQATAYYTDPEGGGKSASARTTGGAEGRRRQGDAECGPGGTGGDSVTARLTDPDGNIRNLTWQWASSESRTSGWSGHTGGHAVNLHGRYAADVGNFLRATAQL